MKLYVDDRRTPHRLLREGELEVFDGRQIPVMAQTGPVEVPDESWITVRTYEDALILLRTHHFAVVSLDHDLGTQKTGYDVLVQIIEGNTVIPDAIEIHTENPVGRARMQAAL